MGAIVSRKKRTEDNLRRKTQAVNAFKQGGKISRDEQGNSEHGRPNPTLPKSEDVDKYETADREPKSDNNFSDTLHRNYDELAEVATPNNENMESPNASTNQGIGLPSKDNGAATAIQSHYRGFIARKRLNHEKNAAVVIQKYVRGHQVREAVKRDKVAATKIQRRFRIFISSKDQGKDKVKSTIDPERPWQSTSSPARTPKLEMRMGVKTKENFENYQDDISSLKWKAEQQQERTTLGDNYRPQKILLIASNIQENESLKQAALEDVKVIVYNFAELTFETLLEEIHKILLDYKKGSKARSIGIVCQGSPGVMYILKGKAVTLPKLEQDSDLRVFIQCLGTIISKLDPSTACVHVISNNVTGNKKGVKLMKELGKVAAPNLVKFQSPREASEEEDRIVDEYFDVTEYRTWKKTVKRLNAGLK